MKLLPAALLTLLSAASSILPSSAAEKESASGVARKLSSKFDKTVDKSDGRNWRDTDGALVIGAVRRFQALNLAKTIVCAADTNGDGVISGEAEVAILIFLLGVADEEELNAIGPGIGLLANAVGAYTVEAIAIVFSPYFVTATDDELNGALGGLIAITAGCSDGCGYGSHHH